MQVCRPAVATPQTLPYNCTDNARASSKQGCLQRWRGQIWDPLSPAFLMHYKHGATLFIPCAFVSWTKEALDHKTPLMKSRLRDF